MRPPIDYFGDFENLCAEILFGSFGKPHLLFADANVLPYLKLCFRDATLPQASILFHVASMSESVTHEGAMPVE